MEVRGPRSTLLPPPPKAFIPGPGGKEEEEGVSLEKPVHSPLRGPVDDSMSSLGLYKYPTTDKEDRWKSRCFSSMKKRTKNNIQPWQPLTYRLGTRSISMETESSRGRERLFRTTEGFVLRVAFFFFFFKSSQQGASLLSALVPAPLS